MNEIDINEHERSSELIVKYLSGNINTIKIYSEKMINSSLHRKMQKR